MPAHIREVPLFHDGHPRLSKAPIQGQALLVQGGGPVRVAPQPRRSRLHVQRNALQALVPRCPRDIARLAGDGLDELEVLVAECHTCQHG